MKRETSPIKYKKTLKYYEKRKDEPFRNGQHIIVWLNTWTCYYACSTEETIHDYFLKIQIVSMDFDILIN